MKTPILTAYLIYVPLVTILTLFVARTLFKNGRIFMLDIFNGKKEIAFATNKLFEVGFYLLNLGFAFKIMKIRIPPINQDAQHLFEVLAGKIGFFTIYLGIMLFINLYLFFRGRKASKNKRMMEDIQQGLSPGDQVIGVPS